MAVTKSNVTLAVGQGLGSLVSGRFAIGREVQRGVLADRFSLFTFIICLLFVIFQALLIVLYWKKLPPEIPLFYSKPWGSSMLARAGFIWLLPSLSVLLVLINFLLMIFVSSENRFLARVLLATSIIVGFSTFWGTLKILTLLA